MSDFQVLALPCDVQSASVARRFVRAFGADVQLGATEVECLIATELVTNAVLHGGEPVEMSLQRDHDEVTIEVADGDPRVANVRMRVIDHPRPGGRGLRVVASLATRWGTRPFRSGKTVWATTVAARAPLRAGNGRA